MQKIKNKSLFIFFLTVAVIFSFTALVVKADEKQGTISVKTLPAAAAAENKAGNATGSAKGQINAQAHRSAVANFVQSLLSVAGREQGGIGEQVRVIAQQQNDSEATTSKAIEKVQTRSKIKTFLIGSDYKNLGALRSEMVQTRNRIDQLNRLLPDVQDAADKAEIQSQIQTLTQEETNLENFIQAQEGKFSLFGWLIKLFNK
jgi:hypothetical protein